MVCIWLLVTLCASSAAAQYYTEPKTTQLPPQLSNVAIEQKLNQQVPLDLTFRDASGRTVQLKDYFRPGKPVLLSLVYFNCRMLCSEVLASLAGALKLVKFDAGNQFQVLTVSFDPRDTVQTAADAKKKYLAMYGHPGAENGWHFLTGDQASITALTNAVGFHYRWDPQSKQFAHAAGIMLLTPQGRVAQYYYGARYYPSDLRLGLIQASSNRIGTLADQIVLYCYCWDPHTGRYGAIVSRILQLGGGLTVLILGGLMLFLFKAYPNRSGKTPRGAKSKPSGTPQPDSEIEEPETIAGRRG